MTRRWRAAPPVGDRSHSPPPKNPTPWRPELTDICPVQSRTNQSAVAEPRAGGRAAALSGLVYFGFGCNSGRREVDSKSQSAGSGEFHNSECLRILAGIGVLIYSAPGPRPD